jgi:hypothetical protein
MKQPRLGNQYTPSGVLFGFRDYITGDFTPAVGFESYALVSDVVCDGSDLILDEETGLALQDEDEAGAFITDGDIV